MTDPRLAALTAKYSHLADPGMRDFMVAAELLYPENATQFDIATQRLFYSTYVDRFRAPRPAGVTSADFSVGDIACRSYAPSGAAGDTLLYLHGGGLVLGNLDTHDDICADLCAGTGFETVAVQYRLAPEHPFPAAYDDCRDVLDFLLGQGRQVVVAGNSSGAALAAALAHTVRDQGRPGLIGQVLVTPGLGGDMTRGSYVTQSQAPGLSTADVVAFRALHRGGDNPVAQPLLARNFANLAPAFLVAAGLDPLHDDCAAYAAKLNASGVAAVVRDEPVLVHDFIRARHMSSPARASFNAIVAAIIAFAA